ncbi:DJ-1/PfpI family protein [Aliirhizobium cellulosilyticum]|jgi:putative intracellular protease/amidase|uniref:Putative intracellular protease/amidase n=1 Tax=Aliirhizobium cellulosilyticum TaxID=393664 RepID=A0A7W6S845_9HYPH|nr:DJ-1/PfpI family protein [Rhizobium cellulosilyticum]MBB4348268.1 putative intracellular protease/amidase [Rhizobium cellulosilyticum]MBB4411504.1 putative intracellular protease/amidase [Rhizobium cellulosilyticum]MBB4446194.1 putative intracellular protease/amidase [Rhizobium cellulosilyticum]
MTAIVVALTPEFADWECALLMAVARSYLGVIVKTATGDGSPVTSMGGLNVTPDLSFAQVRPEDFDALVVPGGLAWENKRVPADLHDLVRSFRDKNKMAAGICAAASMLAGAGVLNDVKHTGNRVASHQEYPGYSGEKLYVDGPKAVSADGVVTAAGTAPFTFTVEILKGLGLWDATAQEELSPFSAEHR